MAMAGSCRRRGCELLCLLRLHEIALANPEPVEGLRAMVDEIVRLPATFRAVVGRARADDGRLRYLAHVGVPDRQAA